MTELFDTLRNLVIAYGLNLLGSVAIFVIGRWLAKYLVQGLRSLLVKARVDQTLIAFFANILYYVTFAITEQVKLRFDAAGISIPFPQRDVHFYPMAELSLANTAASDHS